jgi:hypothetical protein
VHGIIRGYVSDGANGEPLIGVNVYLEDEYIGTATDRSGFFLLNNVPGGDYTLVADYLGYGSETASVAAFDFENVLTSLKITCE